MHVLLYWTLRTVIFLVTYLVLASLKWFDVFAVLLAVVVAWIIGYLSFPGLRKKAAAQMDGWISRGQRGIDSDAGVEDAEAEDARAAVADPGAKPTTGNRA